MLNNDDEEKVESNGGCHQNDETQPMKLYAVLKKVCTWELLKVVIYGQGLSLLICGTAITSKYLQEYNISVPLTQGFINYALLAVVYTTMLCLKKDELGKIKIIGVLKEHWWKYIILAIIDVEANFVVVLAYQYTSLTSVQLLDCFVIPIVMILSFLLLKVRYIAVHYIGVVIALVGVACMVGADLLAGKGGSAGSNPGLGDVLVLAGATGYAITNVSMEFICKNHKQGNVEILGMYGLFCPIVSGIQIAILEREALASIHWDGTIVLLFIGFGACMFLLYSLLPVVMKCSSATAVNLSLLTADLYALFAGLFLFQDKLSPLYVVSFITIVLSLVIYNSRPPVLRTNAAGDHNESSSNPEENNSANSEVTLIPRATRI